MTEGENKRPKNAYPLRDAIHAGAHPRHPLRRPMEAVLPTMLFRGRPIRIKRDSYNELTA